MRYGYAEVSTVARAQQKDAYYIHQLDGRLRKVLGMRRLYGWLGTDTARLAECLYHLLTAARRKTLGEEYCQILPVDVGRRALPGPARSILLALLRLLPPNEWTTQVIVPLHRALFYWTGGYSEVIRRLLDLRYIYHPQRQPTDRRTDLIYRGLAVLTVLVTAARIGSLTVASWRRRSSAHGEERAMRPEAVCSLCLGRRRDTAVTPCGHLFCWECIYTWLNERTECPLCRHPCKRAHLYCIIDPWDGV